MSLYQQGQSPVESHRRDAPSYESQRPAWDSRQPPYQQQPPQHFQPQPRPEGRPEPPSNYWDEEGSDSDVSRTFDMREPVNRIVSPVAAPRQLPQVASPRILNSLDEVQARLYELERIDDHNAQKLKRLEDKRKRKDDRIIRRRAMEDEKIKSVYEARARKDDRIRNRRQREDEAFRGADKQLGVEELDLRRRLRSLKRGLPIEDTRNDGGSTASMSPPLSQYQGGPPPPKRHQSGPPGQNESPVPPQARPMQPAPATSQYHFYQPSSSNSSYPVPYHHPPQANHAAQTAHAPYHRPSPSLQTPTSTGSPRPGSTPVDSLASRTNGFNVPGSPVTGSAPPPSGPIDTRPPPPAHGHSHAAATAAAAPTYDTRPPPPTTGFTSVNQAQPSGFATVNARGPTYATTPPSKAAKDHGTPKSEGIRRGSGKSPKNTTPITVGGLPLNKRTPSTTHPYQMSEAFANRHHHCERTDELNRGIWTSYGYMGSRDVPTGPPVEMYLRCNHDDCKRIDWRTVHGLQCHIVKNHEQPKGTIGSLEKALAIYGVPVSEIAAYEKAHGLGSAGQMADPKNQKIKNRTKEAMQKSESPASGGISTPTLTPSASYTSNAPPLGGPLFPGTPSRDSSSEQKSMVNDLGPLKGMVDSSGHQKSANEAAAPPNSSFVAVRNTWSSYVHPTAPAKIKENKSPTPSLGQSPVLPAQPISVQKEVQGKTQLTAGALSDTDPATATAVVMSKKTAELEQTAQPASPATTPAVAPVESETITVEARPPASTGTSELQAEILEEKPNIEQDSVVAAPVQPQSTNDGKAQEQSAETKAPESETTTQDTETPPKPPTTPSRRPSRRESVTLSKSAQKDLEASTMQSPKMSKADGKRSNRRASVAVSTASVSANVSVDGQDGDGEKSGDEADKATEKESVKSAGSRRNATGRFLRKGR